MQDSSKELYLDLLKKCLTRQIFPEEYRRMEATRPSRRLLSRWIQRFLAPRGLELVRRAKYDADKRAGGLDTHPQAETMSGIRSLDHLQWCVIEAIRHGVPGDLIETGVWRGGASILMRAICKVCNQPGRTVWVADSFQGHPEPDSTRYPVDAGSSFWTMPFYRASLEEVKKNFERYALLDDQVQFLPGWFSQTLPACPAEKLAVMRLNGDLYESTMEGLAHLYPKLSLGGYVIIADYVVPGSKAAVDDFRASQGVTAPLVKAGGALEAYWQKTDTLSER